MNAINKTFLTLICVATLASSAATDSWLVKNTGLTSSDAIILGTKAKDRVELTLKEYREAKARNLPSGKEVVVVTPSENVDEPVDKLSFFDNLSLVWNMFQ